MKEFLERIAAKSPTPGGGSVAAMAGAMACSLAEMVCNLTIGKKKYRDVEEEMIMMRKKMNEYREKFLNLVDEDADAFNEVMKAYKEKGDVEKALKKAAFVPYKTAKNCLSIINNLIIIAEKGNKNSITDAGVAALMAISSFKSALLNVKINLKYIEDKNYKENMSKEIEEMSKEMEKKFGQVMEIVEKWL